jgi:ribosomal protein L11 methyltransferase
LDHFEIDIAFNEIEPWRDIAVAVLEPHPFDGFVETKTGLLCYIQVDRFTDNLMQQLNSLQGVEQWTKKTIPARNWNADWEASYEPVFVNENLAIAAPFHAQTFTEELVLRIQPQMSFGTGHHQTTKMMAQELYKLGANGLKVLDMGAGTGVLAILAEKLGASEVLAVDNDQWSVENAIANVQLNSCKRIKVVNGEENVISGTKFELILANINKNTLLKQISVYSSALITGGKLLISGFYSTDKDELVNFAGKHSFVFEEILTNDEWALLRFSKTQGSG